MGNIRQIVTRWVRVLREDQLPYIFEEYEKGRSLSAIGRELGCSPPAVGSFLKRRGIKLTRKTAETHSSNPAVNCLIARYKSKAKRRGIPYDLHWKDFERITAQPCHYCKTLPHKLVKTKYKKSSEYVFNGIDRVDSDGPYTVENCVPCCFRCNCAKSDLSVDESKEHINLLFANFVQKRGVND